MPPSPPPPLLPVEVSQVSSSSSHTLGLWSHPGGAASHIASCIFKTYPLIIWEVFTQVVDAPCPVRQRFPNAVQHMEPSSLLPLGCSMEQCHSRPHFPHWCWLKLILLSGDTCSNLPKDKSSIQLLCICMYLIICYLHPYIWILNGILSVWILHEYFKEPKSISFHPVEFRRASSRAKGLNTDLVKVV